MFSKLFLALAFVFGLTLQAHGHALIAPAIGVTGTPARSDVTRPSNNAPCGRGVNVDKVLASSTPVIANGDTFTATITNFNLRTDGSRQVTAAVDTAATGDNFVDATVTQNGDPKPKELGSEQLSVQLPAGTTCTGGASGNQCLVSFKTTSGFGNCVLVQQDGAAAASNNATASTTGNDNVNTGNATTSDTTSGNATATDNTTADDTTADNTTADDTTADSTTTDSTTTGNATTGNTTTGNTTTGNATTGNATTGKVSGKKNNNSNRDIHVRAVGTRAPRAYRRQVEAELQG